METKANEAAAQAAPGGSDIVTPRRVGLLFVHGIGEQERWEHTRGAATRLAQLLKDHPNRNASVNLVDHTQGWSALAGAPEIAPPERAPIVIQYRAPHADGAIDFECHEVWWADLGKRRGLVEAFTFWAWGLGQWGAPIYATRDASKLDASAERDQGPKVHLPISVGKQPRTQIATRLSLAWAGIAATMITVTLSVVLRLVSFLTGTKASTDLIVDYLGDVEVYQQRGKPGEGEASDPGLPKRVAIRRRMVTEMVAMGARDYESWSILAHSLGSIVAFNGIGEIGHALPNYCDQELWDTLPGDLTRDADCPTRDDPENMMPARPAWLSHEDCINKTKLFGNLTNFVTYGSPLGTFAAIWPRIVAFEQGVGRRGVFANTKWMNIVSGTDPVSGLLDRYSFWVRGKDKADLPHAFDLRRPTSAPFGLSHIAYFVSQTRDGLIARIKGNKERAYQPSPYADFYDDVMAQLTRRVDKPRTPVTSIADPLVHDRQRFRSSAWVTTGLFLLCFAIVGLPLWAFGLSEPLAYSFPTLPEFSTFPGPLKAVLIYLDQTLVWLGVAVNWSEVTFGWLRAMFGWGLLLLTLVAASVYFLGLYRKGTETKADIQPIDYDISLLDPSVPTDERKIVELTATREAATFSLRVNRLLGAASLAIVFASVAFVSGWGLFHIPDYPATHGWALWLRPFVLPILLVLLFWVASAIQAFVSARNAARLERVKSARSS